MLGRISTIILPACGLVLAFGAGACTEDFDKLFENEAIKNAGTSGSSGTSGSDGSSGSSGSSGTSGTSGTEPACTPKRACNGIQSPSDGFTTYTCSGCACTCPAYKCLTGVNRTACNGSCDPGTTCDVQCDVADCTLKCAAGSSCLLRCSAAKKCELACIDGKLIDCGGGTFACNEACPP